MKSVVFISTGQPTTNPRLVKEAETLRLRGYNVKVIYCFYQQWAEPFDEEITARNPQMFVCCGGHPKKNKLLYFKTRIRQKICNRLAKYIKAFHIPENAISRTHTEAFKIARKLKADIYIAHNLGALPAAVLAARYHKAKVGYDAEDMHSGQYSSVKDAGYRLNKYIEEKYFKHTAYFTAASPLIALNYHKTYPYLRPVIINNVFPKTSYLIHPHQGNRLKILWFSQTIGADRGLECAIKALSQCRSQAEIHLVGQISANDREAFTALAKAVDLAEDQVQFHAPLAPDQIFEFALMFDAGLASETGSTLNRDICLTNKIFTYLQSGLAIIASDTQAQKLFLQQYPHAGLLYKNNDIADLANCIDTYTENSALLWETRQSNYQLGQTDLNWEQESTVFTSLIQQLS